ncbi:MAG: hypothetical protein E6I05_02530 [Chloroflexi bacterium]|nr:MAG: hypothetical protein E6I05_02530 [Chloroflexota bacterium]
MLKASRFKWAVLLFAGAVFTMVGVLIFFAAPGGRVGGIVAFVFFGLCAAVAAIQLVFRSTLTLTTGGFMFTGLGRRVTRRWKDIDSFVVVRTSALSGLVGIRLSVSPEQTSNVRRAAKAIAGYDGGALRESTIEGRGSDLPKFAPAFGYEHHGSGNPNPKRVKG